MTAWCWCKAPLDLDLKMKSVLFGFVFAVRTWWSGHAMRARKWWLCRMSTVAFLSVLMFGGRGRFLFVPSKMGSRPVSCR